MALLKSTLYTLLLTSLMIPGLSARERAKSIKIKQSRTVGDILKNIRKTESKSKTRLQVGKEDAPGIVNEAKNRNLRSIKPPSAKRMMSKGGEISRLEQVVDDSIAQMFRLINKYKRSERRGELWLRQGELYVEKARLVEQRIFNEFDRKIALWQNKKLKRKPRIDLSPAKEYYKKAETLYSWFLRDFKKDPKIDQALFFLGYINFELGNEGKGEHYYTLLTKKFPKSTYVVEANFALGEHYFEKDQWKSALDQYNKVITKKNNRLYSFAYYKRAWCLYRVGLGNKAVKSLEQVIRMARRAKRDGVSSNDSRIRLASEALRDIVLFYSESGSYKRAELYFRKLAGTKPSKKMLENLAYLYSAKGRLEEGRYIFKTLIAKDPDKKESYNYQKQIVLNYSNAGNRAKYKRELVIWVRDYNEGSRWYQKNNSEAELIKDSATTREKLLRVHTLKWHQNYQNTKSKGALKEARFGYDLYFEHFRKANFAHQMYFYSAELYFDLENFPKASEDYQSALITAKPGFDKFLKKSSLNRLISIEKNLPSTQSIEAKTADSTEPITMPNSVRGFVNAGQDHVKRFPTDKSTTEVKFRIARIYYLYNRFEPAESLFKQVLNEAPRSKYAEYSANLLLDIYNVKEDYSGMARVGNEILSVKGFQNSQLTNDIQNIVEKAAFNQGQGYEKKANYVAAAKSFKEFAVKYPGSNLAVAALYNAAVNYERAGEIIEAIPLYEKVKVDPKAKNKEIAQKSQLLQANLFEKTGDLEKAAFSYRAYADKYTKDPIRANLYFNAAIIFSGAKKHRLSIGAYQKFNKINPRSAEGRASLLRIAEEYESLGNFKLAKQNYQAYLNSNKASGEDYAKAAHRMAKIFERERSYKKSNQWYRHLVAKVKGKGRVNFYRADAKFQLTMIDYRNFVNLKIPKNTRKQQAVVQKKISMLDKLNKAFASIIRIDSGEQVISSLIWSGKSYAHLATAIQNAPMPKGLNQQQKVQYTAQIKNVTAPMFKTSKDNYRAAVRKAYQLDLYSPAIAIAFETLSVDEPNEFPYWDFQAVVMKEISTKGFE